MSQLQRLTTKSNLVIFNLLSSSNLVIFNFLSSFVPRDVEPYRMLVLEIIMVSILEALMYIKLLPDGNSPAVIVRESTPFIVSPI